MFSFKIESKENNTTNELISNPNKNSELEYEIKSKIFETSLDTLWYNLVFIEGGCLTGGQHVQKGIFGNEGCVMTNSKEWETFFSLDKKLISDFLISKISDDTTETNIHTCPFFTAIEGEVAVYGLQIIYKRNWYDFDEFVEFKNKEAESSTENHQAWLQGILKDKKKREILVKCWEKLANT